MPDHAAPVRSLVSRRAVVEIVRAAVLGSYGVAGFVDDGVRGRLRRLVGLVGPGIRVRTLEPLAVDLRLTVAFGLPIAEVARQVDSAVRYSVERALGRSVEGLTIHVGGLAYEPASVPPPDDAAASGSSAPNEATEASRAGEASAAEPPADAR